MSREKRLKMAVDRFVGWKLPKDFSPDAGISFKPNGEHGTAMWPIGTNIFSADQAQQMFEYCLPDGWPTRPDGVVDQQDDEAWCPSLENWWRQATDEQKKRAYAASIASDCWKAKRIQELEDAVQD